MKKTVQNVCMAFCTVFKNLVLDGNLLFGKKILCSLRVVYLVVPGDENCVDIF